MKMTNADELRELSERYRDLAENAEEVDNEKEKAQRKAKDLMILNWLGEQPLSSHFDIEKNYARENKISLSEARKALESPLVKYTIQDKSIPDIVKDLRYHRRTLKGDTKVEFTQSIDNLIDAYSDHLSKSIDEIYWVKKYKPIVQDMVCSEDNLLSLSKIDDEDTRREVIDTLCKYWEAKIDRNGLRYGYDHSVLTKEMTSAKKEFKKILKNQKKYLANWSEKDEIKKQILTYVCDDPGISVRQIHDRLPRPLQKKTSPTIISKMATSQNITNVRGQLYKFSDEIKKDIYAYTAAFIDSDGYITMDKNYNPRVGLVATGDRGKAFMTEMHKSLGLGRLHLDQKSPQDTRPVNRLNFYAMDDVKELLTKCLPHFKMKKANAEILLELIRMKKSHKKAEWYDQRKDELFKLMKYENHKDHVGYDFSQYDINIDTVAKLHGNSKMVEMDRLEGVIA
tara:strand:- start:8979 stop:10340 length:1362 start_codon:yes stop_codon:yes gene_type:complete